MRSASGACSRRSTAARRRWSCRVHGAALGGAVGLVACCDVAIAGDEAVFAFPETKLGLVPAVISPFVLARIGPGPARRYFLTGERFGADTALRIGLVHEVDADLGHGRGPHPRGAALRRPRGGAQREATRAGRAPRRRDGHADRVDSRERGGPERPPCVPREAPAVVAIRKLLVANRGEIAARIFRTCDRLGIATVAVEAPDDRGAFHTRRAGEVMDVLSYLFSEEIIRAARRARADAIHPGYGFLAENAEFAEAVEAADLVWVGPPPDAMSVAASKLEAKELAAKAGVPTLPSGEPGDVGYPLILKAAAGGGGRGMRVVRDPAELEPALDAARREAQAAFGDGTVFAERLVEGARHVEVQLLGDAHGTVRHAGARDCSIQRRHQKILEETPPPGLEPEGLARICAAAVELGRLAGYENAGTAEFLVVDDRFWFIELNARLQVEHPVTELVTGLDLVEEQLRIAAGEPLAAARDPDGHAVEARLYAEDPVTLPSPARRRRAARATGDRPRRRGNRGGRPRPRVLRPARGQARRVRGDAQ